MRTIPIFLLVVVSACSAQTSDEPLPSPAELAPLLTMAMARCVPSAVGGMVFTSQQVSQVQQELLMDGPDYPHGLAIPALSTARLHCIIDAGGNCERVRDCVGVTFGIVASCTPEQHCDGNTRVMCTDFPVSQEPPLMIRQDCAALGQICAQMGTLTQCVDRPCTSPDLTTRCDGDLLATCYMGFESSGHCRRGSMCSVEAGTCVGAGDACTRDVCIGDVFIPCETINHRATTPIDCAGFGHHCMEFESLSTAGCVPPETGDCIAEMTTCDGDVLRFCGDDRAWHTFDCVAHGYAACDPTFASGVTPNGCIAVQPIPRR